MRNALFFAAAAFSTIGLQACSADEADHSEVTEQEVEDWNDAYASKEDGKADTTGCSGVKVPDQGNFNGRIALTFDDGPGPSTTRKVMEVLRAHDAPATFFALGKAISSDDGEAIVKEMKEDRLFDLASHTWSHANMARLSESEFVAQIEKTTAAIEEATGPYKFFRFPYGSSSCPTADAVRSRGYTIAGWHIDSADWCFNAGNGHCSRSTFRYVDDSKRDDMAGFILQQVRRYNGGILLFHDTKSYTANALDGILTRLETEGYTFIRLDDEETFPLLNGVDPASLPFIGDVCEDNEDCGDQIGGKAAKCLSNFCTINCEGTCPDRQAKAATFCAPDPTEGGTRGICVSQSSAGNSNCGDMPGTVEADSERFIGGSSASQRSATVCLPRTE